MNQQIVCGPMLRSSMRNVEPYMTGAPRHFPLYRQMLMLCQQRSYGILADSESCFAMQNVLPAAFPACP
jgi:hypothetical protein